MGPASDEGFSYKSVERRAFRFQRLAPESLYVEANSALHVAQSFLKSASLPHDYTLHPSGVGYITFGMLLDYDLHAPQSCHAQRRASRVQFWGHSGAVQTLTRPEPAGPTRSGAVSYTHL